MAKQANILSFDEAKRAAQPVRTVRTVRRSSGFADFDYSFGADSVFDASRASGVSRTSGASAATAASAAPRRAIFDERALAEEEGEEAPRKKTLRDKLADGRRSRSKAKAERAFSRQFGEGGAGSNAGSSSSEVGSRAAVYKGEMGQSHRRAARMQNDAASGTASRARHAHAHGAQEGRTARERIASLRQSRLLIASMGVFACALFACVFLYDPAQQYYQSLREHDRLQAEYDAVAARNEALQAEVDALGSDAGVEARAREDFGWTKEDEHAVVVYGLETSGDDEASMNANIVPGSVEAPETWYSPVLDVIFGVK